MFYIILNLYLFFSSSLGTSPCESAAGSSWGSTGRSLPPFQHPSHSLLRENHFTQQLYHKYHSRCLKGNNCLLCYVNHVLYAINANFLNCRTKEVGNRPVTRNEHALQILVILLKR